MAAGVALLKSERDREREREREREVGQYGGSILSSLYNPDGTLCDAASLPLGGRGYVGAYSPEARRERIERFLAKRDKRVWTKKVKYDVRKNFADSRLRVKVSEYERSHKKSSFCLVMSSSILSHPSRVFC